MAKSFALSFSAINCLLCRVAIGAFQCPKVLCGSSEALAGMWIIFPFSASRTVNWRSSTDFLGYGVPLGKNSNLST